jgi:hypothetical protein
MSAFSPHGRRRLVGPLQFSIAIVLSVSYLAHVFRLFQDAFWTRGLGDWIDPYFINVLLEHWYHSLRTLSDPSSPPMFFPTRHTLGYSHGLILYAPFYALVRLFLHPFQAYSVALFLVIEAGILCLYAVFRRFLGLSFVESLGLSAFFLSSQNVMNGATGVWSQRASVFLIPPILLLLLASVRMPGGRSRLAAAAVAGLLSTLLFTQDFYTAQFALFFLLVALAARLIVGRQPPLRERIASLWNREPRAAKAALLIGAIATGWTIFVWMYGGVGFEMLGARIRSHDWRRPALIAAVCLVAIMWGRHRRGAPLACARTTPWTIAFALGASAGALVFVWTYLDAYRMHGAFPGEALILTARDVPARTDPIAFLKALDVYHALRPFTLTGVLAALAWLPWFRIDRRIRVYTAWLLAVSILVLLIPIRFDGFSIWRAFVGRLPGFGVIRDPSRIVYVYELVVVLAVGLFLSRLARTALLRRSIAAAVLVLLPTEWNRQTFDFLRPNAIYAHWVDGSITIDPACRSFFIKGASREYMSRSNHMAALYGVDTVFVSLKHSIPTLNGYSAWSPTDWELGNPQGQAYPAAVARWIARHDLKDVCALDIDRHTMTPYRADARLDRRAD